MTEMGSKEGEEDEGVPIFIAQGGGAEEKVKGSQATNNKLRGTKLPPSDPKPKTIINIQGAGGHHQEPGQEALVDDSHGVEQKKEETLLEQKGKRTRKKEEEDKQKTGGVEKKVPWKNISKRWIQVILKG